MAVLTNLRKAANYPLLLRNHYSDDIIAKMSIGIFKVNRVSGLTCILVPIYSVSLLPHGSSIGKSIIA